MQAGLTCTSSGMISPEVALLLRVPLSGGEWMVLRGSQLTKELAWSTGCGAP